MKKETIITIRVDTLTQMMIADLADWIGAEYNIIPSNSEIIRAAIEQMHNKYYSKGMYKSNKTDT